MRPTTFARFDFATGFFFEGGFFAVFFVRFAIGFVAFNDAAARFSFPASAFRAEVGTDAPPDARFACASGASIPDTTSGVRLCPDTARDQDSTGDTKPRDTSGRHYTGKPPLGSRPPTLPGL